VDLITITRKGGKEYSIRLRGHDLTCDMAAKEGGSDAGPSPSELLGCSLGTCIAMMVQSYCDRQGYTDGQVGVSLTLELADDPKRVAGFVVDVELPGDVPENRMAAIRRIAEHCPVHATLSNSPRVDIDFTLGNT
jgi:uncharacterized OsmC-like protein